MLTYSAVSKHSISKSKSNVANTQVPLLAFCRKKRKEKTKPCEINITLDRHVYEELEKESIDETNLS